MFNWCIWLSAEKAVWLFLTVNSHHFRCFIFSISDYFVLCPPSPFPSYQKSLSTIRRILDNLPDLSLVYVHCPLLLKFFLRYPELMGRFGHQILQLWFSWEDCKQTEAEEADFGASEQLNSANPLLPILKSNSSILLILLVCGFHNDGLLSWPWFWGLFGS